MSPSIHPQPPLADAAGVSPKLRLVFMGTPPFAATQLTHLLDAGFVCVGVVTRPDRPVGRKQIIEPSAVKALAEERGLPVFQPPKLDADAIAHIRSWKPDLIIVAAYGRILPPALLELPGLGAINVHASLLPRWRGGSPIQSAIMAGDLESGVTLMLMEAGLDTGSIIAAKATPIGAEETAGDLTPRLATLGANLLVHTLPGWIRREIAPTPQDNTTATLCELIEREDGRIYWNGAAQEIYNRYRALTPWPGVFTTWMRSDGVLRLKLVRLRLHELMPPTDEPFGTVCAIGDAIGVRTGSGVILIDELQAEGKTRQNIRDFLNGNPDFIGSILGGL